MRNNLILEKQSQAGRVLLIFLSIAALTISAKLQIPLWPVPITLQTALVLLLPFALGGNAALFAVAGYIALGFYGLPVFAGPIAGPLYLFGPTGGYLIGFLIAVTMVATMQKYFSDNFFGRITLFLVAHAIILAAGFTWLAYGLPLLWTQAAWLSGVLPFVTGSFIKSILAASVVHYWQAPRA